jgi:hypothetical protein
MDHMDRRPVIGGILAVAGGVVLIVTPFLHWLTVNVSRVGRAGGGVFPRPGFGQGSGRPGGGVLPVSRSLSVHGIGLVPGKVSLVAGIVLVAVGLIAWLSTSAELRRAVGIVGVIAGTAAASVILYRIAVVVDGVTLSRLQATASKSIAPGMVLALLGALAGVAGGVLALAASPAAAGTVPPAGRSDLGVEPTPPPPAGPDVGVATTAPVPVPVDPAPAEHAHTGDTPAGHEAPAVEVPSVP